MNQLSSRIYQNTLIDLKDAFTRYRSSLSGHPTFASGRDGQSFTVDSSNPLVVLNAGNTIKIPTVGTSQVMHHWNVAWFPRLLPYQKKELVGLSHSALMRSAKKSNKPKNQ